MSPTSIPKEATVDLEHEDNVKEDTSQLKDAIRNMNPKELEHLKKIYQSFKRRFKLKSKSELIKLLFQQGSDLKEIRDLARELYEENQKLKGHDQLSDKAKEYYNEDNDKI